MKIICKRCLLEDIDRDAYTEKLMEYIAETLTDYFKGLNNKGGKGDA